MNTPVQKALVDIRLRCTECRGEIMGDVYFPDNDGKPICEHCFDHRFQKRTRTGKFAPRVEGKQSGSKLVLKDVRWEVFRENARGIIIGVVAVGLAIFTYMVTS